MIPVLVTAVGSELACAVIKALQHSVLADRLRLVGCDTGAEVIGGQWCAVFTQVPAAREEAAYLDAIDALITAHRIRILIPTADAEIALLARHKDRLKAQLGCHVLVNDAEELSRFEDKWTAHLWYLEHGIAAPQTWLADSIGELERQLQPGHFPLVLKPRKGGGARSVYRIDTFDELRTHLPVVQQPIVQRLVGSGDEEYTAGTFTGRQGGVRVLVLKRTLKFGMTNTAETVADENLAAFCRQVVGKTRLRGANNIQFRIGDDGPTVIEINPRFSGTAGIRAHFGFNDVEMAICDALEQPIREPHITPGRVLRYMHEYYVTRG